MKTKNKRGKPAVSRLLIGPQRRRIGKRVLLPDSAATDAFLDALCEAEDELALQDAEEKK